MNPKNVVVKTRVRIENDEEHYEDFILLTEDQLRFLNWLDTYEYLDGNVRYEIKDAEPLYEEI